MRGITFFLLALSISTLHSQTITLRDTTNQYDYIIITVPEFVSACESFRQHKETVRDFRTLIVDTTQIFAEFDTSATPQDNIREFISYAGTFWKESRPKFFLIVGDIEAVPNFLIQFQLTSYYHSDFYYYNNIYNSDTTATDFYVGRIPAQNVGELSNYFSKVIEYENMNTLQSWMNNTLFVCEDEFIYGFFNAAYEISSGLPSYIRPYFITEIDTSVYYGNLDSIYNAINGKGCSIIWFEGHVTDSGFASPNWFYLEDLNGLTNQPKYFLSIFASCQFSIIDTNTNFTRELMFLPDAGSIGGVVFTGPAYWGASIIFQNFWAQRLFSSSIQSLGQAVWDSLPPSGPGYWYMKQITNLWADPSLKLKYDITLDVDNPAIPFAVEDYSLSQNFPNPFNPTTNIGFKISDRGFVSLKIFNVLGSEVATLVNEEKPAGTYEVEFNASSLPSGVYFYKLQTENYIETKKMILMK